MCDSSQVQSREVFVLSCRTWFWFMSILAVWLIKQKTQQMYGSLAICHFPSKMIDDHYLFFSLSCIRNWERVTFVSLITASRLLALMLTSTSPRWWINEQRVISQCKCIFRVVWLWIFARLIFSSSLQLHRLQLAASNKVKTFLQKSKPIKTANTEIAFVKTKVLKSTIQRTSLLRHLYFNLAESRVLFKKRLCFVNQ